ncbi:MAG: G8 domain-containing protein, partial [Sphingobacteriaceae bacterium]|nr:G8 domain-containing protein [Sphingobacteriaceae bacterium]
MNNNYSLSSLKGLLPGRRWLLLLSLVFLTANVFGQARNYQFGQSSAAYTVITGGTTSTATGDDGIEVLALPFPFTYAGTAVTDITISTNGFVRMAGGAIFGSSWTNALTSTASLPVLAPYWDDHNLGTGAIVYNTTGTAPNREFNIEFRDLVTSGTGDATASSRARFKVTLKETSNQIVYHYGTSSATTTLSGSIGMNSSPGGAGQFLSVSPGVNATVSTSVENAGIITLPDSGVVYTFTPSAASCPMPWAIAPTAITQTGFTVNWRNAGSASYQYVASTSSALPTGAGTTVSDTFVSITGLISSTAYYVYVRSACTGGTNSGWAGPVLITTGGPVSSVASGLWSNPATWSTGSVPTSSSSVTVSAGDSVIFDVATSSVFSLTVNGVLGVNATAARTLSVAGDVSVAASGSLNFGVPTTGTALRILELTGNFT